MKCLYRKNNLFITEPSISLYKEGSDELLSGYVEPLGSLICDILNEDFNSFLANNDEIRKVLSTTINFDYIKKVVDYCFLYNEEFSLLTPLQRAWALFHNNVGFTFEGYRISAKTEFQSEDFIIGLNPSQDNDLDSSFRRSCQQILEKQLSPHMNTSFLFFDFNEFIQFYIQEMLNDNTLIKLCSNCGKYFIPENRSDTKYCDNISPQDDTKTCKEYGVIDSYKKKLKEDKLTGLYRSIYMQKQMLCRRNPDISAYKEDFDNYKSKTKQMKSDLRKGNISEDSFIKWLENQKRNKSID